MMGPLVVLEGQAIILVTFIVPMVHICKFEDLEPLTAKQVILSLQTYLHSVLRVFLCW